MVNALASGSSAGLLRLALAALSIAPLASAQDDGSDADEGIVTLSPFEVGSTSDVGYNATDAISGTRVNMNLDRVPQTISVVTEDLIEDLNVLDTDAAATFDSSVAAQGRIRSNWFVVRGFAGGNARKNGIEIAPEGFHDRINVSRIEVVKGPAAVLFGIGSPGGTVNVISKTPLSARHAEFRTMVGTEDTLRFEFDGGGPLNEKGTLLGRVTAAYGVNKSTIDFVSKEVLSVNPSFTWRPNEATTLTYIFEYSYAPDQNIAKERLPLRREVLPAPREGEPDRMVPQAVEFVTTDRFLQHGFNIAGPNNFRDDTTMYHNLSYVQEMGEDFTLRINAIQTSWEVERFTQFTGFCDEPTNEDCIDSIGVASWAQFTDAHFETLQADLVYDLETEGIEAKFILGGRYDWRATDDMVYRSGPGKNLQGETLAPRPPMNLLAPNPEVDWDLGDFPDEWRFTRDRQDDSEDRALWVVGSLFALDRKLNVLGGWRQDTPVNSRQMRVDLREFNGEGPLDNRTSGGPKLENYQLGFTYEVKPGMVPYFSYSQSARRNSRFPDSPQEGEGYEAGLRFRVMDGKVSGSVNLFDMTLKNIQRNNPLAIFDGEAEFSLSGKEGNEGVELQLFAEPVEGLRLAFNFIDQEPIVIDNEQAPVTEGHTIVQAFKNEANFFAKYSLGEGRLSGAYVKGGFRYRSDVRPWGGDEALFRVVNPSYTTFDLGFGYQVERGEKRITYDIHIHNLTDKIFREHQSWGERRRATGSVTINW